MQPSSCCEDEEAQGLLSSSHPVYADHESLVLQKPPLCLARALPDTLPPGRARSPAGPCTLMAPATCWVRQRCTKQNHRRRLGTHSMGSTLWSYNTPPRATWDFPAAKKGTASSTAGKLSVQSLGKRPLQESDLLVTINMQQTDDGSLDATLVTKPSP